MTSAQLALQPLDQSCAALGVSPGALKEQVIKRLAAHRAGRDQPFDVSSSLVAARTTARLRSAEIAATVAERYAHSQSYRAFLAAEAERAIQEANAAAEVAALSAKAIADAQNQLLVELDRSAIDTIPDDVSSLAAHPAITSPLSVPPCPTPEINASILHGGLTIRLYNQGERNSARPLAISQGCYAPAPLDEAEGLALDEEIAFRQTPVFEEPLGPPVAIPANLINFPRQLIATRRARPRLAEGPLRGEASLTPDTQQLRIFEVEAGQISVMPIVETVAMEWPAITLSDLPTPNPADPSEGQFHVVPYRQTAPLSLRLMAGIVDGCIVLAALFAFTATVSITVNKWLPLQAGTPMSLQMTAISALGSLAALCLLYHLLFFTFADSTPGMRYARIGLCTFSDENPTRFAMRRRIFALVLSACPLGIGFLWAWLDDDRLGWHDRISRMYQRSY